jgi:hypothetical protein
MKHTPFSYLFPHSNFFVVSLFSFMWYLDINTLYNTPKNNNFVHLILYWFKSPLYLTRLFEVFRLVLHTLISWTSALWTLQILSSSYFTSHKIISPRIGQVLFLLCSDLIGIYFQCNYPSPVFLAIFMYFAWSRIY